jgi:hypothetical protein
MNACTQETFSSEKMDGSSGFRRLAAAVSRAGGPQFRISLEFFTQINELPDVMIGVPRASEKNHESFRGFGFAFGGV